MFKCTCGVSSIFCADCQKRLIRRMGMSKKIGKFVEDCLVEPTPGNVVLIKPEKRKATDGGLILPDSYDDQNANTAIVMGIACNINPVYQLGFTVVYNPFEITEVMKDGKKYLIVPEKAILAVLH